MNSTDEDGVPIVFIGQITDGHSSGTWTVPGYGEGTFTADL